jgi:hypothetical protein
MDNAIICNTCNKEFSRAFNLKKHLNKKNKCSANPKACKFCNKVFTTHSNMMRHIKDSCQKENEDYYKEKIQLLEEKFNKDKQELEAKLKEITVPQIINNNQTNNNQTNNINNNTQANLNMMVMTKDYISKNFLCDPILKPLDDYDLIREGNMITDPHHADENVMFVNTIYSQYERGKIVEYIGDIILLFYKHKDNLSQRSFWCSDASRMKFLVRIFSNNTNTWKFDDSGIMVKEKVIKPLLDYMVKCIDAYRIKYSYKMIDETDKFETFSIIVTSIRNGGMSEDVTKYIIPHFTLNKQLAIKT